MSRIEYLGSHPRNLYLRIWICCEWEYVSLSNVHTPRVFFVDVRYLYICVRDMTFSLPSIVSVIYICAMPNSYVPWLTLMCHSVRRDSSTWRRKTLNKAIHTATYCKTLPDTTTHCNTLQHTATQCNTMQHTATQCIALHHTASHGESLFCGDAGLFCGDAGLVCRDTGLFCGVAGLFCGDAGLCCRLHILHSLLVTRNTHHTATRCNTLQHMTHSHSLTYATWCIHVYYNALQRTATHCSTLQHTATNCTCRLHTWHSLLATRNKQTTCILGQITIIFHQKNSTS